MLFNTPPANKGTTAYVKQNIAVTSLQKQYKLLTKNQQKNLNRVEKVAEILDVIMEEMEERILEYIIVVAVIGYIDKLFCLLHNTISVSVLC
jgi:hypothetical protein